MTFINLAFTDQTHYSQHTPDIYRRAAEIAAEEWADTINVNAPLEIATLELAGIIVEPLTLTGSHWFIPAPDWHDFTLRWLIERRRRAALGHHDNDRPLIWPKRVEWLTNPHWVHSLANAIQSAAACDDQHMPIIAARIIAQHQLSHIANQFAALDTNDPHHLLHPADYPEIYQETHQETPP